ncbi:hypothetical protein A2865_04485 [Candidatus Woesebacteria bacterium RIFCSPHIGHO2_01_FULL_39_17]|uniref:LytR/CpsA/Psr regulator C-terminal domain-containing protein n=3 Tax=Candidatus Woeseibacteriota TaxID=1752722 RepID=A0A0G0QTY8_9BACT|nr:MAG: hypothetical protein US72_C0012G0075 [Microgenomates group bacterium GW2011_GWC1_38_12]KKQ94019.1 MAG: hypothetical protein UT19_C0005G0034 [Candidatus Woesebacteria bacterium GW2011_GWB1_39_10b]KKR13810.1 MAG: hypothetical protein UT40_C0010G0038 [Candidatus Woesebacteria bacterium GW2011_GWA1_39_21b]OGM23415.1 MAG: hypothetical protein A2865_04485 [Candidatus Woesebacteria bacterium RIFCSPHIGHO2_01_FULL_39_17]OGM65180.1 MAG: hypothetical protein A3A52_04780 [Candidatus Woesebacteria b
MIKNIIAIAKDKIIAAEIDLGTKEKTLESSEFGWTSETLDLAFAEIVKRFKTKKFRILVADELSYIVRLSVDSNLSSGQERQFLSDQLKEKIPESLAPGEWDYKEIVSSEGVDGKEVIVFALVRDFYEVLRRAVTNTGLIVEAVEPEVVAKTRDANPIIGLAMKEDITGRDEEVLNIILKEGKEKATETVSEAKTQEVSDEEEIKPEKKGVLTLRMSFTTLILLILFVVGLIVLAKMFLFKKPNESTEVSSDVTLSPSPVSTETPEPTEEVEVGTSEYKVQVQNGSGVIGEADVVAEILTSEGFKNIETGNADSYTYQKTEIRVKKDTPDEVFETINKALNSDYEVILSDERLADTLPFDAIIIIGKRIE